MSSTEVLFWICYAIITAIVWICILAVFGRERTKNG